MLISILILLVIQITLAQNILSKIPECVFPPSHYSKHNKYIDRKAWIVNGCPSTLGDLEDEPFMSTGFNRFHFLELDRSIVHSSSSFIGITKESAQRSDCVHAGQLAITVGNNKCMGVILPEEITIALVEFEYLFASQCMPDLTPVRPFTGDFINVTQLFSDVNKGKYPGVRACSDVETVRFLARLNGGQAPPVGIAAPGFVGFGGDNVDVHSSDVNRWNTGYNLGLSAIILGAIAVLVSLVCLIASIMMVRIYNINPTENPTIIVKQESVKNQYGTYDQYDKKLH